MTPNSEPAAAPAARPPLVQASGIVRRYDGAGGGVVAVDDVSLEIAAGTTVGLVGESGSGKSTFGRVVTGLEAADGGALRFDGADVTRLARGPARALSRERQMVFQDPVASLNPRQTVAQAIEAPLAIHGVARDERRRRAAELLDLVQLGGRFAQRYPRSLSGGQCQRVGIARALALEPRLVVLDEAVSALDVSVQAQVLNLLHELQERLGLTYLFISHDLGVVRYMAQEIVVLRHGRLVERGDRDTIFRAPRDAYTRELIAAVPTIHRDGATTPAARPTTTPGA
ncbi:ATP-binding cassette domain-containing protein [Conexibacter woesei]|uniref:ABC transporter related protein n=1 Tax=Conexibacter woesei (strain DSM 14684 / CCUG 47730 / CIP 108061 / JCM 11494 / NBRC 100937 / ID131577) TaxID=469383 RepID=D3FDC9_CONWI|nr:ATP-binding cassette domain-containing protein [Conexibacter woesei]ADB53521.1 ABC transporter related protein [Conexibacter woesei DSM 14684]